MDEPVRLHTQVCPGWDSCPEHPSFRWAKLILCPPPRGRKPPAKLLALETKLQDLLCPQLQTFGSSIALRNLMASTLSLLSPGLPKLRLRHSDCSLLLCLVIDPPLPYNLGLVLICQGLKARRDGQADMSSLVSGQRGSCDRTPRCV